MSQILSSLGGMEAEAYVLYSSRSAPSKTNVDQIMVRHPEGLFQKEFDSCILYDHCELDLIMAYSYCAMFVGLMPSYLPRLLWRGKLGHITYIAQG